MPSRFDVIVVKYENWNRPPLPADSRLILVDNKPLRHSLLQDFPDGVPKLLYAPIRENVGWVKGANIGLALSTAPFVVLMNDDVEVTDPDWLEKMAAAFQTNAAADPRLHFAAVGPHGGGGAQGRLQANTGPVAATCHLSLDGFGIGTFPLSFFCVMFSRQALIYVGYLDERFSPAYGEDDDWLARAHALGWHFAVQTDVHVEHASGGYGGRKAELQARNEKILKAKWSGKISLDTSKQKA